MSPVQGKSPLVQVKESYSNLDMVTCRLSSCDPGVYNVHMAYGIRTSTNIHKHIHNYKRKCLQVQASTPRP